MNTKQLWRLAGIASAMTAGAAIATATPLDLFAATIDMRGGGAESNARIEQRGHWPGASCAGID